MFMKRMTLFFFFCCFASCWRASSLVPNENGISSCRYTVDVSGPALVFFTYTSDVPSGTSWVKLLLKEARRRPARHMNELKKKEKKIRHKVTCFDLTSLIRSEAWQRSRSIVIRHMIYGIIIHAHYGAFSVFVHLADFNMIRNMIYRLIFAGKHV